RWTTTGSRAASKRAGRGGRRSGGSRRTKREPVDLGGFVGWNWPTGEARMGRAGRAWVLAALAGAAPAPAAPGRVREAEAFMAAYAQDLRSGDRAAIAGRCDRRGAWRVGNGEKGF